MTTINSFVVKSKFGGTPNCQKTIHSNTICCNFLSDGKETVPVGNLTGSGDKLAYLTKIDTNPIVVGVDGTLLKDLFKTQLQEFNRQYEIGDVCWFTTRTTGDNKIIVEKYIASYATFKQIQSYMDEGYWLHNCFPVQEEQYLLPLRHYLDFDNGVRFSVVFNDTCLNSSYDGTQLLLGSFEIYTK